MAMAVSVILITFIIMTPAVFTDDEHWMKIKLMMVMITVTVMMIVKMFAMPLSCQQLQSF